MRILVAEDETIIRLDLRGLLERAGHEVVAEARDGEEAVELARAHEPDLAVMDVKMPRLDGIEAARRMLEERPIPIVILTAFDQRELVERAAEAGVYGYLVKPFREQDVVPAIELAKARYEELVAVRADADSLAQALADRKVIERAKGLLMEREQLNEADAFARLRKASQVSGRPLRVIASSLPLTSDEHADSAEGARLPWNRLAHRRCLARDRPERRPQHLRGRRVRARADDSGRRLRQGHAPREQDPQHRAGDRLVGPPRARGALPRPARGLRPDDGPARAVEAPPSRA
jgi:response regulator NasT